MSEKLYHEMSINEINKKFYLGYSGEEDIGQVNKINGKLTQIFQEVNSYYRDTESILGRIKDKYSLAQDVKKLEYMKANETLPPRKKLSDKARETKAKCEIIETNEDLWKLIQDYEEELKIWEHIKENIKFVAKRIDTASINLAVESKMERKLTNINHDIDYVKSEGKIDESGNNKK